MNSHKTGADNLPAAYTKKNIFVVDHNVPTIDKDAGSRCISNFIDCMLDLNHDVKFWVPNMYPAPEYVKLLEDKGVQVFHGEEFVFWSEGWKKYFNENLYKVDAFLLSRASVCQPVLKYLREKNYKGRIIYFGHDLGYLTAQQEAKMKRDDALMKQSEKIKADEDYMYQYSDHSLVLSYDELKYLKKYITKPLHYIPPYFFEVEKDEPSYEQRKGLLFVGGFGHPPNIDAMKWFMEDIYGALAPKNIPFTIAGSNIPQFIFDYKKRYPLLQVLPNVSVEKLDELYAEARIAVVPLRLGAGVKGKVIEAMAKGVPVAGTARAFEGLLKGWFFPYKESNSAKNLTGNILRIYTHKAYWEKLSAYGKKYVAKHFNRENMKEVIKTVLQ
jgi:O-antigen biosynthesis protein